MDFKSVILIMSKRQKKTMSKKLKESMRMISHQMENINNDVENI